MVAVGPPQKARGIDMRWGARYEFSQFFGSDGDPDPTRYERGIPHVLRLMNSPQFAGRTIDGLVARIGPGNRTADAATAELFLTILSRQPTPAEQQLVADQLRIAASADAAYRELAWALLLSSEFSLNH